jgi:mannose-6-phosphate isomerase-like protein (cupin superfamily)
MRKLVFLLVLTIPLAAQEPEPEGFAFWTRAELEGHTKLLSPKLGEQRIASQQLGKYDGHGMVVIHRDADGEAEVHEKTVDIFIVQTGAGKLVVGGKVVNPVKNGREVRGTAIDGGVTRELLPGNIAHIPANMPHQVLVPAGGQITYVIVKVAAD